MKLSETHTYWFHCGSCGRIFTGEVDFSQERRCPHCGKHPSSEAEAAPIVQDANTAVLSAGSKPAPTKTTRIGEPRRVPMIIKLLIVWLVLMAVIYGVAQWIDGRSNRHSAAYTQQPADDRSDAIEMNRQFLEQALPACREVLAQFLSTSSVEDRLPLVLPHPDVGSRMERYYADNKRLNADPATLKLVASSTVELPEGKTILTQWEASGGAFFDAAFRRVEGKWRLDWNHFVRYSDFSWPLFLAGSGEVDHAEFRLLARRRLANKDDPSNGIGLVLNAPMRRQMEAIGLGQSMMGLSLDEQDGQLLEQAFKRDDAGLPILGADFCDTKPAGMIRVQVRVERIKQEVGYKYRIAEVQACHWYDSKATGLE